MAQLIISDPTLRDGNHAVQHQLTAKQVRDYAAAADAAGITIVEVGHGNGLGASSLQVGLSAESDEVMLKTARAALLRAKLGIHVIPGFATIKTDLANAISWGVDVIRVACHCTEANLAQRHLGYARDQGKTAYGVLMMSHMAPPDLLLEEAVKMESYGAEAVILMDSAGAYLPADVTERVTLLVKGLSSAVGFHAHNNLGMAIANSVTAAQAGATILDGCARGFGAGAGNAQLEVLVSVLSRYGYETGVDFYKVLDAADLAERELLPSVPALRSTSIVSGLAGVFSGFAPHVERFAQEYSVDSRDILFELGRRRVVAGQEDMIIDVAIELAARAKAAPQGK